MADNTDVEILNITDDHSRLLLASRAYRVVGGHHVVAAFTATFARLGTPAAVLTGVDTC